MEAAENRSTLVRRVLQRAARAARTVVRIGASPFPAAAAVLSRTPSLLDCMDDYEEEGESSFHTARSPGSSAASTPGATAEDDEVAVHDYPKRMQQVSSPSPAAADVDRLAAEFIDRFRRNASLELRYCASSSPVTTAARPPMSPDTYFKQSSLHQHHHAGVAAGSPAAAAHGKKSSLRPRPRGVSIKWPTAGIRPTVRV
ncbi:hypothetical protein ABZP36_027538 [Zizania latifolia]